MITVENLLDVAQKRVDQIQERVNETEFDAENPLKSVDAQLQDYEKYLKEQISNLKHLQFNRKFIEKETSAQKAVAAGSTGKLKLKYRVEPCP